MAFEELVPDEIAGIRAGLSLTSSAAAGGDGGEDRDKKRKFRGEEVPIAYVICHEAVSYKIFCVQQNEVNGLRRGRSCRTCAGWSWLALGAAAQNRLWLVATSKPSSSTVAPPRSSPPSRSGPCWCGGTMASGMLLSKS